MVILVFTVNILYHQKPRLAAGFCVYKSKVNIYAVGPCLCLEKQSRQSTPVPFRGTNGTSSSLPQLLQVIFVICLLFMRSAFRLPRQSGHRNGGFSKPF